MGLGFKIRFRRDTAVNWAAANPVLAAGEVGYDSSTKWFKIGDGDTAWNSLGWLLGKSATQFAQLFSTVSTHVADVTNPHDVTFEQLGVGPQPILSALGGRLMALNVVSKTPSISILGTTVTLSFPVGSYACVAGVHYELSTTYQIEVSQVGVLCLAFNPVPKTASLSFLSSYANPWLDPLIIPVGFVLGNRSSSAWLESPGVFPTRYVGSGGGAFIWDTNPYGAGVSGRVYGGFTFPSITLGIDLAAQSSNAWWSPAGAKTLFVESGHLTGKRQASVAALGTMQYVNPDFIIPNLATAGRTDDPWLTQTVWPVPSTGIVPNVGGNLIAQDGSLLTIGQSCFYGIRLFGYNMYCTVRNSHSYDAFPDETLPDVFSASKSKQFGPLLAIFKMTQTSANNYQCTRFVDYLGKFNSENVQ